MKLAKLARKYQTIVLGGLVFLMAISLVFWGPMLPSDTEHARGAGEFFNRMGQKIKVSFKEFELAKRKRFIWERWIRLIDCIQRFRNIEYLRFYPEPKEEEIHKRTWEDIVLLKDSEFFDIHVDDAKVVEHITRASWLGLSPADIPYFVSAPENLYKESLKDHIRIEELLGLFAESEFCNIDDAYKEYILQHKRALVRYCFFDPQDIKEFNKPIPPAEISSFINANKSQFEIPEKIRVDYLMVESSNFKKDVQEPKEEELKNFYDENRDVLYEIKEEKKEGEEKPTRYKSFDEVRQDIVDRLKLKKAEVLAYALMEKINLAIGDILSRGENPDFKKLSGDFHIRYGETPFMDSTRINELEKIIGNNSGIGDFAFGGARGNDIVTDIKKTTTGFIIYRLLDKKNGYKSSITNDVKNLAYKGARKKLIREEARKKALELVSQIEKTGFEKATQGGRVVFKSYGYFDRRGDWDKRFGTEDIAMELKKKAFEPRKDRKEIEVGNVAEVDIGEKSYVVYVEDLVDPSVWNFERELKETRDTLMQRNRMNFRQRQIDYIVKRISMMKDFTKKVKEKE
jgi:hypothetical protein